MAKPKPTLRLVAPNHWALHHLCRASDAMLRAGRRPARVVLDLRHLTLVDESMLASLRYAHSRWVEAGARVIIEGCNREVAETLWRHGFGADLRSQPACDEVDAATTTLH